MQANLQAKSTSAVIKRKTQTYEEKLQIIADIKKGKSTKELCAKFDCEPITIRRIRAQAPVLCRLPESVNLSRKRLRLGQHKALEDRLYQWFNEEIEFGATALKSKMILTKAKEIAIEMGLNFKPHYPWLKRWKERYDIKIGGKNDNDAAIEIVQKTPSDSVDESTNFGEIDLVLDEDYNDENFISFSEPLQELFDEIPSSKEDDLTEPELMKQFTMDKILNASVSGLLYKADSKDVLLNEQEEQQQGGNQDKLTVLFICNGSGSFKRIFVIGNSKLTCKDEPALTYYANASACMTTGLWIEILKSLDCEFGEKNENVLMFLNMPIDRKLSLSLNHIKLQCVSATDPQPLHQGIIEAFKKEYRQIILRKQLIASELGTDPRKLTKTISVTKALHFIKQAWDTLKEETFTKAFELAGFTHSDKESKTLYENIPNWHEFLHCDDLVPCYGEIEGLSDLQDFSKKNKNPKSLSTKMAIKRAFNALKILDQFSGKHGLDKIRENIPEMEEELLQFSKKVVLEQNESI